MRIQTLRRRQARAQGDQNLAIRCHLRRKLQRDGALKSNLRLVIHPAGAANPNAIRVHFVVATRHAQGRDFSACNARKRRKRDEHHRQKSPPADHLHHTARTPQRCRRGGSL
jgi:hypothetical protein